MSTPSPGLCPICGWPTDNPACAAGTCWGKTPPETPAYLDPMRDELTRLRTENATLRDTLALRSEALNRTGADNDRLRATIARVEALVKEWGRRADKAHSTAMARHGLSDEAALFAFADTVRHRIADVREALVNQEPARD